MSLFTSDALKLETIDPEQIAKHGVISGKMISTGMAESSADAIETLSPAMRSASDSALDLGISQIPRIREAQMSANQELFSGISEQERLARGDIAQRLEREASDRLGTGITFDEERGLREASRGAFTSRGRFRDTASTFSELTRRLQADRQARLQNAAFASGVLGQRSNLLQQGIQNRQQQFLDPRTAGGVSASQLFQSGIGIGHAGISSGIGLSERQHIRNVDAINIMNEAGRKKAIFPKLLSGVGAAIGGYFGGPAGAKMGSTAGGTAGDMFDQNQFGQGTDLMGSMDVSGMQSSGKGQARRQGFMDFFKGMGKGG